MLHWSVKLNSSISKSPVTIQRYRPVLQWCQSNKALAKTKLHRLIPFCLDLACLNYGIKPKPEEP